VSVGSKKLRVLGDGSWLIGDAPVSHAATLRYLKSHLVWDGTSATVVDGAQRSSVTLEGPPLEVVSLTIDRKRKEALLVLDDGSSQTLRSVEISMDALTGRFEIVCRGLRAVFSRSAHQVLIENVIEAGGAFVVDLGGPTIAIRT
jgi:hypothetical protein